ncbi:MAG: C39 family peptidase [Sedimentisphaerales bacterium]|nr:C39 family peptidase [Sedimentisphaerales bacterium]
MLHESMKMARNSELGIGEYGAVFVSARYDQYPIVMVCHYLPPYYTKVDLAGDKAKHKTGKKTAHLKRYYFLGPRGQAFKMDCEGLEVLLHAYSLQDMDKLNVDISPPGLLKSDYNMAWDAYRDNTPPPDYTYFSKRIQDWEIMPCVEWCRGCSPTSASMVLGYYDRGGLGAESLGLGRLIDHWQMYSQYVDGRTGWMVNVPNVLDELRQDMNTDSEGTTSPMDISTGMERTCNIRNGYDCRAEHIVCNDLLNQWCWDTITDEIDNNRPFVWNAAAVGADIGHSLAVFGYRYNEDIEQDKYVMTYNTWDCPGQDDWHYKLYDNGDDLAVASVVRVLPGGWTWGQTSLHVPNGGEVWGIDTTHDIWWYEDDARTWSADLEYSTDGGVTWTALATVQPSSPGWHKYTWTVPDEATQEARVRIRNYSGSDGQWTLQASDGSEENFTITHPYINLLDPRDSSIWYIGQRHEIRWSEYGAGDFVRLEKSSDNGQTWTLLAASTPNDQQYDYMVTEPVGAQCKIRIMAVDHPSTMDQSDTFEIRKPFLQLDAPSAGAILYPQLDSDIRWSSGGVDGPVHIELSRDSGSTWEMLVANTENDGHYWWKATAPASDHCRIRIRSADNPSLYTKSLFEFTIRQPSILLVQPSAGQTLFLEQDFEIVWTTAGVAGEVRIEKSVDGGALWSELTVIANDGSNLWHVGGPASANGMIRVSSVSDPAVSGTTGVFEIRRALQILYPYSGESCYISDRDQIRWIPGGVGSHVRIEIKQDSQTEWQTLVSHTPNDGEYEWNISEAPGLYQIQIIAVDDLKNRIVSDPFAVERWELLSPNGQEVWNKGETYPIRWQGHKSTKQVLIEYLQNGGTYWNHLTEPVPCSDEYLWTLSSFMSTGQYRIRITLQDSTEQCVDESDSEFEVFAPSIRVLKPIADGTVFVGDTCRILWNSEGAGRTVSIELVRQSLLSGWQEIVSRTTNDGEYFWKVTGPASALSSIRIHSCENPELYSPSTGYFTIAEYPRIELSYPNGGQILYEGRSCNLIWESFSAGDEIRIEISRDDGITWSSIVDATENDGSYSWVVQGPASSTARIRITSLEDTSLSDASESPVEIVPYTMSIYSTGTAYLNGGDLVAGPLNKALRQDIDPAYRFIPKGFDYQLTSVRVAVQATATTYNILDVFLMDDADGVPGNVLATTSAAVPFTIANWVTFPLSSRLKKDTAYWIMFSVANNGMMGLQYSSPYFPVPKAWRYDMGEWRLVDGASIVIQIEGTPRQPLPIFPEVIGDKSVDIQDVLGLSGSWMRSDCDDMTNRRCNQADMDHSGRVDMRDWLLLADQWLSLLPED